jgi:hypothetical protein
MPESIAKSKLFFPYTVAQWRESFWITPEGF